MTAGIVCFARGVATAAPITQATLADEAARSLLPSPIASLIPRTGAPWARLAQWPLRVASVGLVDHLALRSAAIDQAVREAAGVSQLVLLGAGLDARAYRLDCLQAVTVFEVDHPASQTYKRARAQSLAPLAKSLRYVPVDFTRDDLARSLREAGHLATEPSVWVWEGVTMYLPREAVAQTLSVLSAASAPGSRLAVTYMSTPNRPLPQGLRRLLDLSLSLVGEPLGANFSRREFAELLQEHGFVVEQDDNSLQWAARFGGNAQLSWPFRQERLALAIKRS
jgi:methyltransferase (TIGR00027 family)